MTVKGEYPRKLWRPVYFSRQKRKQKKKDKWLDTLIVHQAEQMRNYVPKSLHFVKTMHKTKLVCIQFNNRMLGTWLNAVT